MQTNIILKFDFLEKYHIIYTFYPCFWFLLNCLLLLDHNGNFPRSLKKYKEEPDLHLYGVLKLFTDFKKHLYTLFQAQLGKQVYIGRIYPRCRCRFLESRVVITRQYINI